MKKTPNPVDRHVGSKVRSRRLMLGMSQERLGDALGVTFQQVQKYEKGVNRIGASRLQRTAEALGVSISSFFDGLPAQNGDAAAAERQPDASEAALLAAFSRVTDPQLRQRVIALVQAMAPPE
jgi:transcriptional regulator with XRE-family HTH domain